jgi:integrase
VLYYTGLRPVDVCFLTAGEISDGIIELYPEKTSRVRKKISYKADPKLLAVLNTLAVDANGLYFPDFAEEYRMHRGNTAKGFNIIRDKAGLAGSGIQLYGFRHHFITYQLDSGIEDEAVEAAIGHTQKSVTYEHYYHGRKKVELNDLPEV